MANIGQPVANVGQPQKVTSEVSVEDKLQGDKGGCSLNDKTASTIG